MLLADVDHAPLPVVAHLLEGREDHLPKHSLDAERGEDLVQHGVRACRLGRSEAHGEAAAHPRDALGVVFGVEPLERNGCTALEETRPASGLLEEAAAR